MFGRLKIRAPGAGGKVASGQVTLFREKTDDVRVVLSTLTLSENQAFVASARSSTKSGFSIDVVRADWSLPWDGEYVTINWFAWGADVEKALPKTSQERRGTLPLSNATRISDSEFLVVFDRPFVSLAPLANHSSTNNRPHSVSVVASGRNENRAQVIAVNIVGKPSEFSFVVRVKRLDDAKAGLEEEGTFIDWIASTASSDPDAIDPEVSFNRTGSGTRFDPPFSQLIPSNQGRIFVIHSTVLHDAAASSSRVFVSSLLLQSVRGFTPSRQIAIRSPRRGNEDSEVMIAGDESEDDDDGDEETITLEDGKHLYRQGERDYGKTILSDASHQNSKVSKIADNDAKPYRQGPFPPPAPRSSSVMYVAWEGLVDECDSEAGCSHRGSCVWITNEDSNNPAFPPFSPPSSLPLLSRCACRSPFSGFECDEECPSDLEGLVCSGNGICSQLVPECECFSGWTGELCNAKAYSADTRVVLVVVIALAVFFCTCFGTWFTTRCRRRLSRERRLMHLRRALLGDSDEEDGREAGGGGGGGISQRHRKLRNHNTDDQFEQIDDALQGAAASWAIPYDKLAFGSQIGQGSSSQVFIGLWAGQTVAIKKIAVPRSSKRRSAAMTEGMDPHMDFWLYFKREAGFLATLHHPNIVRFFGVASQQDLRGFTDFFYLVTELCVASLSDLIRGPVLRRPPSIRLEAFNVSGVSVGSHASPLGKGSASNASLVSAGEEDLDAMQAFVFDVFVQIARGMDFLHSKGVVHRDLKCDNVLLDPQNRVKLCDFGISRVVDRSKGYLQGTTTAMIATPAFMAPELISTGTYPCGTKADVYSFGIVLWSFIQWREPYLELQGTHSVYDLMSKITLQGLRPSIRGSDWPVALERFYMSCVDADPSKRPSFDEILKLFGQKRLIAAGFEADTICELADAIKVAWLKTYQRAYPSSSSSSSESVEGQ